MKEREWGWIERKCWGSRMNNNLALFGWGWGQPGRGLRISTSEWSRGCTHTHARTHTRREKDRHPFWNLRWPLIEWMTMRTDEPTDARVPLQPNSSRIGWHDVVYWWRIPFVSTVLEHRETRPTDSIRTPLLWKTLHLLLPLSQRGAGLRERIGMNINDRSWIRPTTLWLRDNYTIGLLLDSPWLHEK